MADYYEIDFRQVHTSKSGDALAIRYQIGAHWYVHLVDGGYSATAPDVAKFIRDTYGTDFINHIVVTHPDRDHAEGLAPILEQFRVGALWMLRPWEYASQLYPYFPLYQSVEAVAKRLQEEYPYIYDLEKIARRRGIAIHEPFQGPYWASQDPTRSHSLGRMASLCAPRQRQLIATNQAWMPSWPRWSETSIPHRYGKRAAYPNGIAGNLSVTLHVGMGCLLITSPSVKMLRT
jgi:hypothetical protein